MMTAAKLAGVLHGKRLLIFDFDGTVADTSPLHAAAFTEVLAPLGVKVDYPSIAGMKTSDAMNKCLRAAGRSLPPAEVAALSAAKQTCVRKMIGEALRPLPGVDEFLRWAKPRYKLAMVTSGSGGTVSLALDKLGYAGWFSPLICADDLSRAKPDPEGFERALSITAVPAGDALVFEDSEAGLAAAAAAGLSCFDVRAHRMNDLICDCNADGRYNSDARAVDLPLPSK